MPVLHIHNGIHIKVMDCLENAASEADKSWASACDAGGSATETDEGGGEDRPVRRDFAQILSKYGVRRDVSMLARWSVCLVLFRCDPGQCRLSSLIF